jgi:hypothetical protein
LQSKTSVALTSFSNPYASMEGVTKEKIKYKRADGVALTGDLYLLNCKWKKYQRCLEKKKLKLKDYMMN